MVQPKPQKYDEEKVVHTLFVTLRKVTPPESSKKSEPPKKKEDEDSESKFADMKKKIEKKAADDLADSGKKPNVDSENAATLTRRSDVAQSSPVLKGVATLPKSESAPALEAESPQGRRLPKPPVVAKKPAPTPTAAPKTQISAAGQVQASAISAISESKGQTQLPLTSSAPDSFFAKNATQQNDVNQSKSEGKQKPADVNKNNGDSTKAEPIQAQAAVPSPQSQTQQPLKEQPKSPGALSLMQVPQNQSPEVVASAATPSAAPASEPAALQKQ